MEKRYKLQIEEERRHDGHALYLSWYSCEQPSLSLFRHLMIDRSFDPLLENLRLFVGKKVKKNRQRFNAETKRKNRKITLHGNSSVSVVPNVGPTPHKGVQSDSLQGQSKNELLTIRELSNLFSFTDENVFWKLV